jgi:hypothetical protein
MPVWTRSALPNVPFRHPRAAVSHRCPLRSLCPGGHRSWGIGLSMALALLAMLALARSASPVQAASSTVGCGLDRAERLVDAVQAATSGGPSTGTLMPGSTSTVPDPKPGEVFDVGRGRNALPVITGNVTIAGNGASIGRPPLGPCNCSVPLRLAQVNEGATLVLQDLTISRWAQGSDPGGALAMYGGTLTVTNTTFNGRYALIGVVRSGRT